MPTVRGTLPVDDKMDRAEVTRFMTTNVHLVHYVLRSSLDPARTTATHVEIGSLERCDLDILMSITAPPNHQRSGH